MTRCLVIAGTHSGVGKTTFTCALARALTRSGLRVQTFKCGPDYLDPTLHAQASGRVSHQLDLVMMGEPAVRATFEAACADADVALIEGVMGLYDGKRPDGELGSTAELAKKLDLPVLLVFDAAGMARSAAALVHGFRSFDPQLRVVGAVATRTGSRGHGELLRATLPGFPLFSLTRADELALPERHLGLVAASQESAPLLDAWGDRLTAELDVPALLALADARTWEPTRTAARRSRAPRVRIGLARDEAFSFYYPFNLRALEDAGAELVPFSPIHDRTLPSVHALYLGGGYPELHAAPLSENRAMRDAIRDHVARGRPLYAECGGLMYSSEGIRVGEVTFPMLGLVEGVATLHTTLQALGYRELTTTRVTPLGPAGTRLFGHEFRYSELSGVQGGERAYAVLRGADTVHEGFGSGNLLASYVHLHWGRTPQVAEAFVRAARSA